MSQPLAPVVEEVVFLWRVKDFETNEDHYRKPENVDLLSDLLKDTIKRLRRAEKGNEETIAELSRLRTSIRSLA